MGEMPYEKRRIENHGNETHLAQKHDPSYLFGHEELIIILSRSGSPFLYSYTFILYVTATTHRDD